MDKKIKYEVKYEIKYEIKRVNYTPIMLYFIYYRNLKFESNIKYLICSTY